MEFKYNWVLFGIICSSFLFQGVENGYYEKKLLRHLFIDETRDYWHDALERPIRNESLALDVNFKITLVQIIDVDEKNQMLKTNLWLNLEWFDYHFRWDPNNFDNISQLVIPGTKIWKPDILLYNSADEKFDGTVPVNVVVKSSGKISMIPPGMFTSTCKINITYFPFDKQICELKFGTWTYTGEKINLKLQCEEQNGNCSGMIGEADTSSFIKNGEWDILEVPAKKNVEFYPCCPDQPFIDIKFYVKIRRKALYYIFNLITPCIIISTMSLLVFTLPPGAGEKISLGVTIMLSLTMFLFMVADKLPQTSSSVALIGLYFSCIMIMCSFSVVFTVLVLNCHHKSGENEDMPNWIKIPVNHWLATMLLMRPRNAVLDPNIPQQMSVQRDSIKDPDPPPLLSYSTLKRASQPTRNPSLLTQQLNSGNPTAYTRVSPYNCLHNNENNLYNTASSNTAITTSVTAPSNTNNRVAMCAGIINDPSTNSYANSGVIRNQYFRSIQSNNSNNDRNGTTPNITSTCSHSTTRCSLYEELECIITELKTVTDKINEDKVDEMRSNEWRFAARVIDRFCLIIFALFTSISSVAILNSAPEISI